MQTRYTPSVNIVRDQDVEFNYLPTPNVRRVADQIATDFENGIRSFTLIGSYGTGKSSFLWALSNVLRGKKHFFDVGALAQMKVDVLPLVSEYQPLMACLSEKLLDLEVASPEQIFAELYHRYRQIGAENRMLVLFLDEFGKFLEYAAKHSPEKELYFLQQFAEFINNPSHNILLITALHQNFDAYSLSLAGPERQEWSKVKGRFREITFNEPVEQLLWLASERLSQNDFIKAVENQVKTEVDCFLQAKAFPFNAEFATSIARKLYPLDLFSASTVALAMQRYGQNERSLFSFLEGTEHTGLRGKYNTHTNPFYNLANLYDNLIFNYYSHLNSKHNIDFFAWMSIKGALERVESDLEEEFLLDALKIVKSVGLLNIFASKGANLDKNFLLQYASTCLGVNTPELVLKALTDHMILSYRNYQKRFIIQYGTDVDLDHELRIAEDQLEAIDVVNLLNKHFSFPAVFAKEYYFKVGTPRIFEFCISKSPEVNLTAIGDVDGHINLIFNEHLPTEQVIAASSINSDKAILYGVFKNAANIRDLLIELEKIKKTIGNIPIEDKIAHNELQNMKQHQEALLNHYVMQSLYSHEVSWIFNGEEIQIQSKRELNRCLTRICTEVYHSTPIYRSELVNRSKLSSQIHTAKRAYFRHLVHQWGDADLGFEKDKFPPEKTIYLTLLRENGLVFDPNNPLASISIRQESNFKNLWIHGEQFLEKAKKHRLPLVEFYDSLTKPPFKLKQGLIDFWLPTFLFLKRDDFALFGNGIYIPDIQEGTLELLAKSPKDYSIKSFDVEGVRLDIFNRYRQFLNQGTKNQINNLVFIETIRPFLTFYKSLPEYAKHTNRLRKESIAVRRAISVATEPEKTFFEDFPTALGITLDQLQHSPQALEGYIQALQDSIREIRTCHDELVTRFELFILEEVLYEMLPFEQYKQKLRDRFASIKEYRLLPHHKTFLLRLSSALDDRKAWLSSIAQAVVGKTLENLRDEDEPLLFERFKNLVLELDTLSQISEVTLDDDKEDVFGLEITSFEAIEKKVVRFPKKKKMEINHIEEQLKKQLGNDKILNIAALANILKDLLQK